MVKGKGMLYLSLVTQRNIYDHLRRQIEDGCSEIPFNIKSTSQLSDASSDLATQ